jgi:hypothetical protein
VIIARIVALVNPACVGLSLLPGRHTCFLRLPQVDRECSVQIRNMGCRSWNNRKYADIDDCQSLVLSRLNRREPIRVPDQNSTRGSPTFSPRDEFGQSARFLKLSCPLSIPKYFKVVAILAELNSLGI